MNLTDKYIKDDFIQTIDGFALNELIEFSKTVRVLLIFPNEEDRQDIIGIFKIFFHDIDDVCSAEDGIAHFNENKYDLVVAYDKLTGFSAFDLMQHIRTISRNVTTVVLLDESANFLQFVKLGIDGYLTIPIDVKLFVDIMQKLLNSLLYKERYHNYRINLEQVVEEKTEALVNINKSLEKKIKEEVEKNIEYQSKMFHQAKLASLGEMISNIAHQWRQPLSVISTLSSAMQVGLELGINNSDDLIPKLETITNQTQYLSTTINTFSEFIKDDKVFVQANLLDKIGQAKIITEANLKDAKIELVDNIDYSNVVSIKTVRGELPQVFINIINNAKDALLENKTPNPQIILDLYSENNFVFVTISDNSGGIPESILPRIFEPYFTTKHQSQGTGLGIHMSYRIITDSLNGKIYATNIHGGAKFTIQLPLFE